MSTVYCIAHFILLHILLLIFSYFCFIFFNLCLYIFSWVMFHFFALSIERTCPDLHFTTDYIQWCSLVFCSEYTVIFFFFLPSLILIRTRAASHTTTLAKQGSTLTIIFRSTCAANKKIIIWVTVKKFWSTFFSITKMCLPITK